MKYDNARRNDIETILSHTKPVMGLSSIEPETKPISK